ncbi:MAG TPA: AAA family ATPase [Solirubrobacteraceae bacterium]|jgi:CO dehydrogenase maturation factor|nr:AAA family ATPase [Solirubrobacteraceae bacterium]
MKIAVAGKGGVGKTTISGTLARTLARSGATVLALDADVNPMLGLSLGLGMQGTEDLAAVRQALRDGEIEHAPTAQAMLDEFGSDAPDGVRVVVASRMDGPDSGCGCCGVTPDQMLRELDSLERTVLGDLEAGVGVLSRMAPGSIDVVLVVANPTAKSIEVARRAIQTPAARESRILVVANRVRDEDDIALIRDGIGDYEMAVIPEDPMIARADAEGVAPLDLDDAAPGVQAIIALGERLAAVAA